MRLVIAYKNIARQTKAIPKFSVFQTIVVRMGTTKYPTIAENNWSSTDYLGDALIIEAGNEKYPKMSGSYMYL